jgi:hypothetical protein
MPPVKSGAATAVCRSVSADSRLAIVDEFGDLDLQVSHFKTKIQRHQELRSQILSWYPDLTSDASTTAEGSRCDVQITPCDRLSRVTLQGKKKLCKLWGLAEFLQRCSLTMRSLESIPQSEHALYTVQERTGPRHLKVLPKAAKAA